MMFKPSLLQAILGIKKTLALAGGNFSLDEMSERREEIERGFQEVVERFRQKGAVSPEKAMTAEELNLLPRFEDAMKRRLGSLGVFVEVNGKYYLSEERLRQIEELRTAMGAAWLSRKRILTLRTTQTVAAVLFMALFLVSIFVQSLELRVISILFLTVWLAISVFQMYYPSRVRRRIAAKIAPGRHVDTLQ
jgi:hypothetical protein